MLEAAIMVSKNITQWNCNLLLHPTEIFTHCRLLILIMQHMPLTSLHQPIYSDLLMHNVFLVNIKYALDGYFKVNI